MTHNQRELLASINAMHEERFSDPQDKQHLKQPPTSMQQINRGGAWIKTVSISPRNENLGSPNNTYVIAIGPSNESHEEVEAMFGVELQQLRSGNLKFYHGRRKTNVFV